MFVNKVFVKLMSRGVLASAGAIFITAGVLGSYLLISKQASLEAEIAGLQQTLSATQAELELTKNERDKLAAELDSQTKRVSALADTVEEAASTVSILNKLSKTDKELLQKYSKVYFLNEHYVPDSLADIPQEYLYDESVPQQIHTQVLPFLERMIQAAARDGITLWINSAYRSFGTQSSLKSSYKVIYGSGANAFSADQGYSEHQLGTTVDFTTRGIGGGYVGFEDTPAYAWLSENAYKYGFTLSYPEGNAYYIFEPWHWRFVGVQLATDLFQQGKHFYDLPQREIDQYLISIFD